ncbi:YdeI/OmpD-associated family protein [Variovorax sp. J31P207]|uniref:YdeI/OmpD-associated family protein n=1 Tax=Variovorax sp. J31P207 TaxID=3053510 RepID=UPI002575A687|nr:YdeI/OmpD-associated family protein [Variovorax sp. J31P207]MDM0066662.1 YdeI/OmpD-associated family protein [Variovorax sp. J31P207]
MPDTKSDTAATLFKSAKAFDAWLKKHHATSDGLWLKIAKKGAGEPSVTYPEAVEIALCWGWIDGQKKGLDDRHFLQRFTPRRARSIWSKINVEKVAALIEAGRIQPAGQAQIDAAKHDGRWGKAYDSARTSSVPDDLQAALEANPKAKAFFATISASNRYAVLWRVQTAVKPETRARRITKLVEMLGHGEVVHIFRPKARASD